MERGEGEQRDEKKTSEREQWEILGSRRQLEVLLELGPFKQEVSKSHGQAKSLAYLLTVLLISKSKKSSTHSNLLARLYYRLC